MKPMVIGGGTYAKSLKKYKLHLDRRRLVWLRIACAVNLFLFRDGGTVS